MRIDGVVTFLDVLGWKGVYARLENPLDALGRLVGLLEDRAQEWSRGMGSEPAAPTKVMSVSDTLVLYTPAFDHEAMASLSLHARLADLAMSAGLERGIPVRGATAFGRATVSQTAFVGPAIDEAAAWHEQADWFGVFMTPSALFVCDGVCPGGWVYYPPPLKAGHLPSYSVHWKIDATTLRRGFRTMAPITSVLAPKFINTLQFVNQLVKKCAAPSSEAPVDSARLEGETT